MEIHYAIKKVETNSHTGAFLQDGEYGYTFSYHANSPHQIKLFETEEEAIDYIKENLTHEYVEIVKIYSNFK